MAAVTRGDLVRVFLRSLVLQGSWSFRGMQSVGFAYAMEPALRRIHGDGPGFREAVQRHLRFFNTHPFLAAAVLGCAVRLEQDGGDGAADQVHRVKRALMGPCGAWGDGLFWGGVKPLVVLAAVWSAYQGAQWAPAVLVAVFAAVNLTARIVAFRAGYRDGIAVVERLGRADLIGWGRRVKAASATALGVVVAASHAAVPVARWGIPEGMWVPVAGGIVVVLALAVRRGVRPEWLVYGAAVAAGGVAVLS